MLPQMRNIINYFVKIDCSIEQYIDDEQLDYDELICFECKQEPYLFAQIYLFCKHNPVTFCINHFRKVRKTCSKPGHSGAILRQFNEHQKHTNLLSLKKLFLDGFDGCTNSCTDHAAKAKRKKKTNFKKLTRKNTPNKNNERVGQVLRIKVTRTKLV